MTVEMSTQSGILSIAVADTGGGFEPDYLPRAFEAFSRAEESRSRAVGGAGLGLAIARGFAEAMGGSVTAEETPGGGATFVVRLAIAGSTP